MPNWGNEILLKLVKTFQSNWKLYWKKRTTTDYLIHSGSQKKPIFRGAVVKPDTGIAFNFHSVVLKIGLRGKIFGFFHTIVNSCSTWNEFHPLVGSSWDFIYQPLSKIHRCKSFTQQYAFKVCNDEARKGEHWQNRRGRVWKPFWTRKIVKCLKALRSIWRNCYPQLLCILHQPNWRTVSRTWQAPFFSLKSNVVNKTTCPACHRSYIGQTVCHLSVRITENGAENTPVSTYFKGCNGVVTIDKTRKCVSIQIPGFIMCQNKIKSYLFLLHCKSF